jgi:hypothetical protein
MSAQTYFVIAKAENALAVPVAALKPVSAARQRRKAKAEGRRQGGAEAKAEGTSVVSEAQAAEQPQRGRTAPIVRATGERRARTEDGKPRERAYLVQVVNSEGKVEDRRITVGA